MKLVLIFVLIASAIAAEVKEAEKEVKKEKESSAEANKDKRQLGGQVGLPGHYVYRTSKKQEQGAPVQEHQEEDRPDITVTNAASEEYRPGQVFSVNTQELLDLQPERKPLHNQHLYSTEQPEHRQNLQALQEMYSTSYADKQLQQYIYYDPPQSQQVAIQPSRTVIARPSLSANGGEASVGAAFHVSDTGASSSESNYDHELLAFLASPQRQEEQVYSPAPQLQQIQPVQQVQQVAPQTVAPQYQQIERFITKPTKKPTKLRPKVQIPTPQIPQSQSAPQQYLIETTNVPVQTPTSRPQIQYQPIQQQIQVQPQPVPQYRYVHHQPQQHLQQQLQQPQLQYQPQPQPQQRPAQALRYVQIPAQPQHQQPQPSPIYYERPEPQGLKVVAAPKLQQPARPQIAYRVVPQYQEVAPKQFRVFEPRPQQPRPEHSRVPSSSIDRPVTYVKAYSEGPEKPRAIKIFEQQPTVEINPRQPQYVSEQYYLQPVYRQNEQPRYENPAPNANRFVEKPPHSAIYVNKNVAPKKVQPQQPQIVREQPTEPQPIRAQHPRYEQVQIEQHGQSIEEQRAQLPPPKNNKAYTPEEFAALVAAGYSVTPVPVNSSNNHIAQARSELVPSIVKRRPLHSRRNQYLPLRSDEAP